MPIDINKELGLDGFKKEENRIIFESDGKTTPAEFKDFERKIDEDITAPIPLSKKTHKYTKEQLRKANTLSKSYRDLKRFKN